MTPAELNTWTRNRLHTINLQMIRAKGAARLQRLKDDYAALRRAEERLTMRLQDVTALRGRRSPLTLDQAATRQRIVTARGAIRAPHAAAYQQHLEQIVASLGASIRYECLPASNAYAWPTLREIEVEPIIDGATYAAGMHEAGHVANPCPGAPTHRRVPTSGKNSCCPRCEAAAWRWACINALAWDAEMHRELTRSLPTYERFANEAERAEMRLLTGPMGLHYARQMRLGRPA